MALSCPAKQDIQAAYDWWAENRSAAQAERWYGGIHAAIQSLRNRPERCSVAFEGRAERWGRALGTQHDT